VAGAAIVLMGMPLGWMLLFAVGRDTEPAGVPARLIGIENVSAAPFRAVDDGPGLLLPIEPVVAVPTPSRADDAPVIVPGYVLPVDGSEEPAHAGG
jgi:hypothetical protein